MDLARPLSSVVPGLPGRVLGVLGRADAPLTGRAIARAIDPPASQAGVAKVLDAYVREGIVLRTDAGSSAQFALNRDHLAAPLIESLAELRTTFLGRLAAEVTELLPAPLSAYLYGSAARGDATSASDVDIALILADEAPDDERWDAATAELRRRVARLTGNDVSLVEYRPRELFGDGEHWLVTTLRREGIRLSGLTVDDLKRRWDSLRVRPRRAIQHGAELAAAGDHVAAAAAYAEAVDGSRALGDRYGEANSLLGLAGAWFASGRPDFSAPLYDTAATVFAELGRQDDEARAAGSSGRARARAGDHAGAIEPYERALLLGHFDPAWEGGIRLALAHSLQAVGNVDRARDECASAVGLLQAAGDVHHEANALLAYAALVADDPDAASESASRAMALFEDVGDRHGAGCATYLLAGATRRLGRSDESRDLFRQALEAFRDAGDRVLEGEALLALGMLAPAHEAVDLLTAAVAAFRDAHDRAAEARARSALGRTLADAGRTDDALTAYREAVAAFDAAGAEPLAEVSDRVRATRAGWGAAA